MPFVRRPSPRRSRLIALAPLLLALGAGCAHAKPKARVVRPPKPWMEARSLCIFPMAAGGSAHSPEALDEAMSAGWESRMDLPADSDVVQIEGTDHYPKLEAMTIDLTDASIDAKRNKHKLKPVGKPEGSLRVETLEFVARPLLVERAKVLLGMTASDAKLDLRRDKKGQPMLALADAKDGEVSLEVSKKDIDALLLKSAREAAGRFGVSVDRTKLKLDIIDGRSIRADLKLDTRIGFLPAGLRFKARVDVDDQLNGKITRLSCEGDELLGPIISGFIDPALKKYEGKKRPLVGFPLGDMELKDFSIRVDDAFHLDARFGRGGGAQTTLGPAKGASAKSRITY